VRLKLSNWKIFDKEKKIISSPSLILKIIKESKSQIKDNLSYKYILYKLFLLGW